jgi:hypothetical protein
LLRCTRENASTAISAWIADWFELVAQGRIAEACARLDEPNSYGQRWSPEQIVAAVEDTFDPESRFARRHPEGLGFTKPSAAYGNACAHIDELDGESGYWAEYNVPLNGEFSDLTAQFRFRWLRDRLLASLHDLDVL